MVKTIVHKVDGSPKWTDHPNGDIIVHNVDGSPKGEDFLL